MSILCCIKSTVYNHDTLFFKFRDDCLSDLAFINNNLAYNVDCVSMTAAKMYFKTNIHKKLPILCVWNAACQDSLKGFCM